MCRKSVNMETSVVKTRYFKLRLLLSDEFLHHLQDSKPKWLFTSKDQLPRVKKACEEYRDIKVLKSG